MPNPETLHAWQVAVTDSTLPAATRLTLLVLSLHMNWRDLTCFPSVRTLKRKTSYARSTVCRHLAKARDGGWIDIERHGSAGQGWRRNSYRARLPDGWAPQGEAGPAGEPPSKAKVVRETTEGGRPRAQKVVRQSDPNYPKNDSFNSAGADARTARAAPAPAENDLQDGAAATEIIAAPSIGPEALRAWTEVRRGMRAELGDATYAAWIAPLRLEATSPSFVLSAPGKFHRDRVMSLYLAALRALLCAAFGAERPIEWRVRPEPAEPLSTPSIRDRGVWT
jgi:hypothetical protein